MKDRQLFILLIVLSIINAPIVFIFGQSDSEQSPYGISVQSFSPQVAGMIRHDNIGTPLNSGLVDLSIPLVTYKDRDFEFPIALKYDSQGFKPADAGNFVGLNWILSGGGVIHREIMGIPDDLYKMRHSMHNEQVKGFLHVCDASKNPFFTAIANKDEVLKEPGKYLKITPWNNIAVVKNTGNIEASSDIYHFSFGNHSGKFVIGYDGSVNVVSYSGGKYKVDLSEYHFSFSVSEGGTAQWQKAPKISIITDDGYVYTFGGNYASLEYMALSWIWLADINPDYDRIHRITAFNLTEITAPNGRRLHISYFDPIDDVTYHQFPNKLVTENIETLKRKKIHQTYLLDVSPFQHFTESFIGHSNDDPLINSLVTYRKYCLNKISLISSISTDAGNMQFYYSDRKETIFNQEKDTPFGAACGAKLDSIKLSFGGNANKRINLSYQYTGRRMLLASIYDSQKGRYTLSYNSGPLVEPFTIDIDHWNYWSGKGSNKTLIPDLDYSQLAYWLEGPFTKYRSLNREATGKDCDVFMLNEITYPTGGHTRYEYEPHDYERYIAQDGPSYGLLLKGAISGDPKGKIAGGARLKRMTHYDGSSLAKTAFYQYTADKRSKRSSGILLKRKPLYIYGIHAHENPPFGAPIISYRSDGHQEPADYASEYIKYTNIFELQSSPSEEIRDGAMIGPLDDVRKKAGIISFGPSGDYEILNSTCTIQGSGSQTPSIIRLRINGSKKSETREYKFIPYQVITFNPIEEFGKGTIDFYMDVPAGGYLDFKTCQSKVKMPENGYKEYVFTDFSSNCDYEYRTIIPPDNWISHSYSLPFISYYGKKVLDHSRERGILSQVNSYKANGELAQTMEHKFQRHNYGNYEISVFAHPLPSSPQYDHTQDDNIGIRAQFNKIHQVFKIPLYSYLKTENIITNYVKEANVPLVNTELYKYDTNGYLKTKEIRFLGQSGEISTSSNYQYVFEETEEPYTLMQDLNILSPVTQISIYYGMAPELVSMQKNNYALVENLRKIEMGSPEKKIPVIKSVENGRNEVLLEQRVEHLKFDLYGNPVYLVKDGETRLVYLWSYQGQYPIAHIEGVTYEEVLAALGNTPPENLSLENEPDSVLINNLRKSLPQAHINTFTHEPGVGLISKTDQRGVTTYYDYDERNRLKEVYTVRRDGRREILKHYQYSFK